MDRWWDQALCKGLPLNWWFLEPPRKTGELNRAITICYHCPVREPCLKSALQEEASSLGTIVGIRGGKLPAERYKLIRARRRGLPDPPPRHQYDAAILEATEANPDATQQQIADLIGVSQHTVRLAWDRRDRLSSPHLELSPGHNPAKVAPARADRAS